MLSMLITESSTNTNNSVKFITRIAVSTHSQRTLYGVYKVTMTWIIVLFIFVIKYINKKMEMYFQLKYALPMSYEKNKQQIVNHPNIYVLLTFSRFWSMHLLKKN